MSELFHKCSQEETLLRIQERLNQDIAPAAIIKEMLPHSRDEAVYWGRRLTGWEEYQRACPAQVVALARVISQLAMQAHRMILREDGRVVERTAQGRPWRTGMTPLVLSRTGTLLTPKRHNSPQVFLGEHAPTQRINSPSAPWWRPRWCGRGRAELRHQG